MSSTVLDDLQLQGVLMKFCKSHLSAVCQTALVSAQSLSLYACASCQCRSCLMTCLLSSEFAFVTHFHRHFLSLACAWV